MAEIDQNKLNNLNEELLAGKLPIGWPWRLLVFSIIIFALSVFAYFGLHVGYQNYLDQSSAALDKNLDTLSQQVSVEDQDRFVNFYSKLINLRQALSKHLYASNDFKFLEKNVTSDVYFTEASISTGDMSVKLKGFSTTFDSLAKQIAVFQNQPTVSVIALNDVGLAPGGGVNFDVTISFKDNFLNQPAQ